MIKDEIAAAPSRKASEPRNDRFIFAAGSRSYKNKRSVRGSYGERDNP